MASRLAGRRPAAGHGLLGQRVPAAALGAPAQPLGGLGAALVAGEANACSGHARRVAAGWDSSGEPCPVRRWRGRCGARSRSVSWVTASGGEDITPVVSDKGVRKGRSPNSLGGATSSPPFCCFGSVVGRVGWRGCAGRVGSLVGVEPLSEVLEEGGLGLVFFPGGVAAVRELEVLQVGEVLAEDVAGWGAGVGVVVAVEHEDRHADGGEPCGFDAFGLEAQHVGPGLLVADGVDRESRLASSSTRSNAWARSDNAPRSASRRSCCSRSSAPASSTRSSAIRARSASVNRVCIVRVYSARLASFVRAAADEGDGAHRVGIRAANDRASIAPATTRRARRARR